MAREMMKRENVFCLVRAMRDAMNNETFKEIKLATL